MQFNELWEIALLAAPGDEDGGGKGYFLIAILIISAIHWLSQRLKEKREAEQLDEISEQAREAETWVDDEEWDTSNTSTLPPRGNELKQFFESLAGTPAPVAPPPPPPPPVAQRRQAPPTPPPAPASKLTREEQLALEALKSGKGSLTRTRRQRIHSSTEHTALSEMLRDPVGMRNAFILKEILDTPVAAREGESPHTID